MDRKLSAIDVEILWGRLITAADEAVTTLVQASFSSVIRDFHDYACALFDENGRMLAQSTRSTPGLLGILPFTMPNFLAHPASRDLKPGDVLVTNDPWLASGHLIDITVATPVFDGDRLVGYALCVVHHLNMGGRHATLASRDVYEEGLKIPIVHLYRQNEPVQEVFDFLRANVREPDKVIGDVRAQVAANNSAASLLIETMHFSDISSLKNLGDQIISRSEASMRAAIRELPDGRSAASITMDGIAGYEAPVTLSVATTIKAGEITLDFTGSSDQIPRAVNVPLNMTRSYSFYLLKCVLDPNIPNNEGCMRPIDFVAAEGSVLNATFPAATWGRTMLAHMLPELISQALATVVPDRIIAGSGSTPLWYGNFVGRYRDGHSFYSVITLNGGMGARADRDGLSCISYPGNVANIPLEVIEQNSPLIIECKEFAPDYAGAGRTRGGAGQRVTIELPESAAGLLDGTVMAGVRGGRFGVSIRGVAGGEDAPAPVVELNGQPMPLEGPFDMRPGDRLTLIIPGGAGYGPPSKRDPALIEADRLNGMVTGSPSGEAPLLAIGAAE